MTATAASTGPIIITTTPASSYYRLAAGVVCRQSLTRRRFTIGSFSRRNECDSRQTARTPGVPARPAGRLAVLSDTHSLTGEIAVDKRTVTTLCGRRAVPATPPRRSRGRWQRAAMLPVAGNDNWNDIETAIRRRSVGVGDVAIANAVLSAATTMMAVVGQYGRHCSTTTSSSSSSNCSPERERCASHAAPTKAIHPL